MSRSNVDAEGMVLHRRTIDRLSRRSTVYLME